ncbi:MAG: magnesium transporter [Treponema sp.]|jgi:magnesium transporter|nr:magnesium transporter [Treponema sp.]
MKDRLLDLMKADNIDFVLLKELLPWMNTVDIAEIFSELDKEKHVQLFRLLSKSLASDVFSFLAPDEQQQIIEVLSDREIGEIINNLFADDAADFIEEMPADVVKRVLQTATPEKRAIINQLLKYPEDSAGSIMTTEYVDLHEETTVAEAFNEIRKTGVNKETIYTCYVIRQDRLLVGTITVKKMLLAQSNQQIGNIMDSQTIFANTSDDRETIAGMFKKYGLMTMPVVDNEQRLVGIITVDDIVQVIEEETTEDIEIMHALAPSDDPYLKTGIMQLARNRIIWLMVLMLSATITGIIISEFENAIAVLPVLVAFIPMLMGTGGNAGCQSSTLIIRGMAIGEIKLKDAMRVLWREIRVASLCGLGLCAINVFRIYLMGNKSGQGIVIAVVVSITLFVTLLISKCIGALLPMLAKKIKLDPAVMAAPLLTTIVDAVSLIVYFSVAKLFLKI